MIKKFEKLFKQIAFAIFLTPFFASATDYRFDHLSISDGLVSSHINKVYQEENGFIWLATDSGASRYDGIEFLTYQYNPNEKNHISNNYIVDIVEDASNGIWLGTEYGLNLIRSSGDIEIFLNDSSLESISSNIIHDVFNDTKDNIWVATSNGVSLYKENSNSFINYHINDKAFNFYTINEIDSVIYFGTEIGLYYLNSETNSVEKVIVTNIDENNYLSYSLISSYKDNLNNLWLGTEEQGVFSYNKNLNKVINYDFNKPNKIQSIAGKNNIIYIGHIDDGITVYDNNLKTVSSIKTSNSKSSILSNRIESIFVDQSDILWVSTRKGVSYYSSLKSGSYIYSPSDSVVETKKEVYSFVKNKDEMILSTEGWIQFFNIEDESFSKLKSPYKDEGVNIWNIESNGTKNLWVAHDNGLSIYNLETKNVENFSNSEGNEFDLPNNEFYTVYPINDEQAWITGYNNVGVILFDKNKGIIKQYLNLDDNPYFKNGNYTIAKEIDSYGNIWLATTSGLIKINPLSNEIFFYNKNVDNLRITDLYIDNDVLWASTAQMGILKITNLNENEVTIDVINKKNKIPDLILKNLTYLNGELWITSNNKIFKYNIEKDIFQSFQNIITDDDILFIESSIKIYDNNIFIGSNKGLVKINLSEIKLNDFKPNVHITKIMNGKNELSTFYSDNISLNYSDNSISFNFSVTDFNNHINNMIKYKLEGFDKDWIISKNINTASYTNLYSGKYSFIIYGSNSDGKWSNKYSKFDFEIKTAWWIYALSFLILIVVLFTFILFYSRIKQIKTLKMRANYDSLTRIPNRSYFNKKVEGLSKNKKSKFAIVFIDLDDFKEVNDSMGHAVGDELICQTASRLHTNIRVNEFVCRLGGDEFAIIIDNIDDIDYKSRIEYFRTLLNKNYILNDKITNGSASIGVSIFPSDSSNIINLFKNADIAMYESKRNGKNNISYFNQKMNDDFNEKTEIRGLLHTAIEKNEFEVYYQPKICVSSKKIMGMEALIRWYNEEKGFISPAIFIPESENNGTINAIGEWVLRESCKQGAKWIESGEFDGNISVNMSPIQFYDANIISVIKQALFDFDFPANKLEIEITESVLMDDVESTLLILKSIRALGVKIALDDFGTGYSSLNYLIDFPIDVLKIDRSLIKDIESNPKTEIVIKNIFNMADDLNFIVVVEGVETQEQFDIVTKYKCELIQGYFFSPPVKVDDINNLLRMQK